MEAAINNPEKDITEILLTGAEGEHDVQLIYDIKPAKDSFDTMDFLYRDIIWGDQEYAIENFRAKINMPAPFDAGGLNITRGSGTETKAIAADSEDKTISINAQNIMPGEWLTMTLMLPEGYFTPGNKADFERVGQNFDIDQYTVHATVNEQNTIHLEEAITVRYYTPQHGIYRDIPTFYSMGWQDNGVQKKVNYRIPVENITSDGTKYKVAKENHYTRIFFGDESKLVEGIQTYHLSYDLPVGDDRLNSRDFVYFNLIGNGWPAAVNQAQFEITLPKPFDEKSIHFYSGLNGETKNDVDFFVQGNTVYAKTTKQLLNYEGVTVDISLPQGYFTAPPFIDPMLYTGIFYALVLVFGLVIFLLFGKNKRAVPTVEFSAPEGLNPAETGMVLKGYADNRDILALILSWAAKGCVTLTGGKKAFTLTKQKALKEKDAAQTRLFSGLFGASATVTQSSGLDFRSLFETAKADILSGLNSRIKGNFLDARSAGWKKTLIIVGSLPSALFFGYLSYASGSSIILSIIIALVQGFIAYLFMRLLHRTQNTWRTISAFNKAVHIVLLLVIPVWFLLCVLIAGGYDLIPYFAACMVCFLLLAFFTLNMKKRTQKGLELLGKVKGFRNFIKTAEKDKIERLVQDDPRLFYTVLPYAYALGVTSEWVRQFEGMYNMGDIAGGSSDAMERIAFFKSVQAALESMNSIRMTYGGETYGTNGVSGGSTGDGGGSAGGGFGGGGGGTW